jgi:hypothetical protein
VFRTAEFRPLLLDGRRAPIELNSGSVHTSRVDVECLIWAAIRARIERRVSRPNCLHPVVRHQRVIQCFVKDVIVLRVRSVGRPRTSNREQLAAARQHDALRVERIRFSMQQFCLFSTT